MHTLINRAMSPAARRRHPCVGRARVVVEVHSAMTPHELSSACGRVEALLSEGVPVRAHVAEADLAVVGALAHMRLWARRLNTGLEITGSCVELAELVGLTVELQVRGEPEALEERGVEEVVDMGDPTAGDLDHLQ